MVILFFLIAIVLVEILYEKKKTSEQIKNSNIPLIDTKAKIKLKYRGVDRSPEVNGRSTAVRFFITFSQAEGKEVTLKVPYLTYLKLKEGDEGTLKYKDTFLVEFTQD